MHKLIKQLDEKNIDDVRPGDSLLILEENNEYYEFAVYLNYNKDSGEVIVLDYAINVETLNEASYPLHRCLAFDSSMVLSADEYFNSIER